MVMKVLGIDIGGSAIKYGWMEGKGDLFGLDVLATPAPATPKRLANEVMALSLRHDVPRIGVAFPAVVRHGVVGSHAHIDDSWLGVNGELLFSECTGKPVTLINDADAALLAEREWGVCRGVQGSVLYLTLGTGIGSAMMVDGRIWWNSELGHLHLPRGLEAEAWAAASCRTAEDLDWAQWAARLNEVLSELVRLCHPERMVLAGGIVSHFDTFAPYLNLPIPVIPSRLGNRAGLMGAALAAINAV